MALQFPDPESALARGTLLWVGDRDHEAFSDAYDFCEAHVSQMAYRIDLSKAISRPATAVRTIICCFESDSTRWLEQFQVLSNAHSDAKPVLLLGPLCSGARPSPATLYDVSSIAWHEWPSALPAFLRRCGWANEPVRETDSVAVVASSYANASALLTIASASNRTAVWCRPDQLGRLRNFDEIWWDDSATTELSLDELLSKVGDGPREHVWITGNVSPRSRRDAVAAGIGLVIAKPGDFSLLIERIPNASGQMQRKAA